MPAAIYYLDDQPDDPRGVPTPDNPQPYQQNQSSATPPPYQDPVPVVPPAPDHVTYWSQPYITSKTYIFNLLILLPAALDMLTSQLTDDPTLVPTSVYKWLIIIIPIVNMIIRNYTVRPVTFTTTPQPVKVKFIETTKP